jgi:hypothetical protein
MQDWPRLIGQFTPLSRDDVPLFAPPHEMERAIAVYNKAIYNLGHDSSDIALIALHKLTATYPLFTDAALLLGYCLAESGRWSDAREQIELALLGGLPDHQSSQAVSVLQEIREQESKLELPDDQDIARSPLARIISPKKPARPARVAAARQPETTIPASAILLKTSRRKNVRVASARERRAVVREDEPNVRESPPLHLHHLPAGMLRITFMIIVGLAVLAILVYAGVFLVPPLIEKSRERSQAISRLEWLIDRLEALSGQNPGIDEILKDYQKQFDKQPAGLPTTETVQPNSTESGNVTSTAATSAANAASATAQRSSTTVPATAVSVTTEDLSVQAMSEAAHLYQVAVAIEKTDLLAAADNLLSARHLLAGIPGSTRAPDMMGDASELSQAVESFIQSIARTAAALFWERGQASFDAKDYQASLSDNLKAYELKPDYYGGGVAYYCGRCYQLLGDYASAKPYYDYVIGHFAGHGIASSAAVRLSEMGY